MIKFQYYNANVKDVNYKGWVELYKFINSIKTPKEYYLNVFNEIAELEKKGLFKEKAKLKEKLHYFTPCVHLSGGRGYANIIGFTGLLVLDFDHIERAEDFKQYLFDEYKSIIAAWLSPSKKGVKALVKIPIVNTVDEFKTYFFGIAEEMEVYEGFDGSGQNCVLALFQSIDQNILFRTDYETWNIRGCKKDNLNTKIETKPTPIDANDRFEKIMIGLIEKGIDKINTNGHPQLRGLCISIGGYIANNYIDKYKALSLIDYKIATNSYLSKGVKGYQTTARWGIEVGLKKPLHINI
jgi:hypothetical protein